MSSLVWVAAFRSFLSSPEVMLCFANARDVGTNAPCGVKLTLRGTFFSAAGHRATDSRNVLPALGNVAPRVLRYAD